MSISAGLRLTGRAINNSQAKQAVGVRNARNFSQSISISRSIRRFELHANRLRSIPQTRSLSFLGWGSSKPSTDFNQNHPLSEPFTQGIDTAPSQPSIESIRTVKASHSTSDAPDPATTSTVEADALQKLETSVLKSQDTASSTAAVSDTPDLASIPEGIGYLKDVCGLDFGWGPTSLMQYLLEHIHITAGLSWSASIIALVFLLRATIYPLAVSASDSTAKFQEMTPLVKEIRAKSQKALEHNDKAAALEAQMQLRELKKECNFSFTKMLRPLILQVPLGYGAWHLLNSCSNVPVPAFETEHWLWVSNLAVGDPWYLLPLATAAMTWANLNTNTKGNPDAAATMPGMEQLKAIFPIITGAVLMFQPACVQIYFLVNASLTQLQVTSLQNPTWRKILNLHPLPDRGPKPAATPNSRMNTSPKVINTTARPATTSIPGTSPAPASAPAQETNRSFVDQGVDFLKSRWGSTKEQQDEKAAVKKRKSLKETAARYEAQRKEDLSSQRSYRNAAQSKHKRQ